MSSAGGTYSMAGMQLESRQQIQCELSNVIACLNQFSHSHLDTTAYARAVRHMQLACLQFQCTRNRVLVSMADACLLQWHCHNHYWSHQHNSSSWGQSRTFLMFPTACGCCCHARCRWMTRSMAGNKLDGSVPSSLSVLKKLVSM